MTLAVGWLSPFTDRSGVGTFSKAITDAMPSSHGGRPIELTVIAPMAEGLYKTRHRLIDIASTTPDSRFYDLFDIVVYNIGNNTEHHQAIFNILRNKPGIVVCHDYVYQHFLATLVHRAGAGFQDYVALMARYGAPDALRIARESNIARGTGLAYAPWDSDFAATEPLGAPLLRLGSALVVHSAFAERYARPRFDGPVLRLGMPFDQRPSIPGPRRSGRAGYVGDRVRLVSFGHVQPTKCIDDVLLAIAASPRLRDDVLYIVSGFAGNRPYVDLLRSLVREHRLEDCVQFALDLSNAELEHLAREADGFINLRFPNTEGASVSLIEQLVTGKPVIVLDSGCYAEVPDDAVIKIKGARDGDAIGQALVRMLGDRDQLEAIGQRGRAHALRRDCAGYASAFLEFVGEHESQLRGRGASRATCLLDVEVPAASPAGIDEAWSEALSMARTTFDLLEEGCLAIDPALIAELGAERIVDYVQAAILRDGTNVRLNTALRTFFRGREDLYRPTRILHLVRRVADADNDAALVLPEICPRGDLVFWEVVAAMGMRALVATAHHAFFGSLSPDAAPALAGEPAAGDVALLRLKLANDLSARPPETVIGSPGELAEFIRWLRVLPAWDGDVQLEPLPTGRHVEIGSSEQRRFLRLFGFFKPEADHAWTGSELGLVYLAPKRGAKRIVLSGYSLDETACVTIAAETPDLGVLARSNPPTARHRYEIDLPELPEDTTLCVSIRSSPARSPAELGLSDDERPLGFCLRHVAVG